MVMSSLTVITASFNSEKTIERTIESILAQDHRPLEYIIIDGKSTDKTCEIISKNEAKFKAKGIKFNWQSEKDIGIYNAWNKGLKKATGSWIAFLGSDDTYLSNSLHEYNTAINADNKADFVTAKAKIVKDGKLLRNFGEEWNWKVFRKEMKILHAGGFLNKDYFDRFGLFNEIYKITGDYEMLLRKGENLKVSFIDNFLVEMDGGGVSNSFITEALLEAKRAKIETGKRGKFAAIVEFYIVRFKIYLKTLVS